MKNAMPHFHQISAGLLVCSVTFSSFAQACTAPDLSSKPKVTQWIDSSEQQQGHALACHTKKTSNQLIGRMENRGGSQGPDCTPYGGTSSSFSTKETLRDFIFANRTSALASMVAATPGNNAAADFPGEGNSLGIVVRAAAPKDKPLCTGNSSYVCKSAVKAKLVFADVGGACTLRTAFPVAK